MERRKTREVAAYRYRVTLFPAARVLRRDAGPLEWGWNALKSSPKRLGTTRVGGVAVESHLSDELLACRAAAGYRDDFEELLHRYRNRVYRICYRMSAMGRTRRTGR